MEHVLDIPGCSACSSWNLHHDHPNTNHDAWCSEHQYAKSVIHKSNRSLLTGLVHIRILLPSGVYHSLEL